MWLKASVSWPTSSCRGTGMSGVSSSPRMMACDAPIISCTGVSSRMRDHAITRPSTRHSPTTTVWAHLTRLLRADTVV